MSLLRKFYLVIFLIIPLLASCWPTGATTHQQLAMQGAYSASIDAQGENLVLGSLQHGGSYWNIPSFARLYNWNHRSGYLTEILYSSFSADGSYALTANYYNLVLWNTQTGESVAFWEAPSRIQSADLSADGLFALLGMDNGQAVLFDVQHGGVLREFQHNGPVISVSLNTQTGIALTGSEDNTAKLWNTRDASLIRQFGYSNQVSLVKLSKTGAVALMVPSSEKAELWDLTTRRKIAELKTAKYRLTSATFIGDERLLTGTTYRDIFEFDAKTGKRTNRWRIGSEVKQALKSTSVLDIGWRDSKLIAVGSNGYLYTF
ncbi:MAG: WD40 repeat protein [Reinekea sp.]